MFRHLLFTVAIAATSAVAPAAFADDIGVAKSLAVSAVAFDRFNTETAKLDGKFTGAKQVADSVALGASYDAKQFEKGMIAYAAFAAMREPAFVAGVRRAVEAAGSPAEFERQMLAEPWRAARIDGADLAQARLRAALDNDVRPSRAAGVALKQAAYDVQHQAWSKGPVADHAGRLARVKSLSTPAVMLDDTANQRLQTVMTKLGETPRATTSGPETYAVDHALALAALAIIGRAGDTDEGRLSPLLTAEDTAWCFNMAKLNYFQCLSVAGPHYEDVFCLGVHAVTDTAQCVIAAASLDVAGEPPRQYASEPSGGVLIPVVATVAAR